MASPIGRLYSPLTPQFQSPGRFTAWIVAQGFTKVRASSVALRVRKDEEGGERDFCFAAASRGDSTQWRAAVQGVLRAVEVIPDGSRVTIRVRQEALANSLNEYAEGWRKHSYAVEGGKQRPAAEKWEALARHCRTHDIRVEAVCVPEHSESDVFAELRVSARQAADREK